MNAYDISFYHHISQCCKGENCAVCGRDATHKAEEVVFPDDPFQVRHTFTAYLCCEHFGMVFGEVAKKRCQAFKDNRLDILNEQLGADSGAVEKG